MFIQVGNIGRKCITETLKLLACPLKLEAKLGGTVEFFLGQRVELLSIKCPRLLIDSHLVSKLSDGIFMLLTESHFFGELIFRTGEFIQCTLACVLQIKEGSKFSSPWTFFLSALLKIRLTLILLKLPVNSASFAFDALSSAFSFMTDSLSRGTSSESRSDDMGEFVVVFQEGGSGKSATLALLWLFCLYSEDAKSSVALLILEAIADAGLRSLLLLLLLLLLYLLALMVALRSRLLKLLLLLLVFIKRFAPRDFVRSEMSLESFSKNERLREGISEVSNVTDELEVPISCLDGSTISV